MESGISHKIVTEKLSSHILSLLIEIAAMRPDLRSPEEVQVIANFFSKYRIFPGLKDRTKLYYLASRSRLVTVRKYDYVFHEGDEGELFYIILKGRVKGLMKMKDANFNRYFVEEEAVFEKIFSEYFGEAALLKNIKRSVSIRAEEDCHFLTISKEDYASFVVEGDNRGARQALAFLQKVDNFGKLAFEVLYHIAESVYESSFNGKVVLARQDEMPKKVFFIKRGVVHREREIAREAVSPRVAAKHAAALRQLQFPVRCRLPPLCACDLVLVAEVLQKRKSYYTYTTDTPIESYEINYSDCAVIKPLLSVLQDYRFPSDDDLLEDHILARKWQHFKGLYVSSELQKRRAVKSLQQSASGSLRSALQPVVGPSRLQLDEQIQLRLELPPLLYNKNYMNVFRVLEKKKDCGKRSPAHSAAGTAGEVSNGA